MTENIRLIPRLDIKGINLIKGIHLEGLRVLGKPSSFAQKYYAEGADELIYMDSVATLYGRNNLSELIKETAVNIFIPITVGGGIRTLENAREILRSGADKVAINTAAVKSHQLITDVAHEFGSQCMVLSIEAKQISSDRWEVYIDNGREPTGIDVIEWAKKAVSMGVGEILVTSIDREGTRKGFDLNLIRSITCSVNVPVIASGGMGAPKDLLDAVHEGGASGVAMADILHYRRSDLISIREFCESEGLKVRKLI